MKPFPHIHQPDAMDCGATCLAMITKFYGKNYTVQHLREICYATREGVSMLSISDAAEKLGMHSMGVHISFEQLAADASLPCIVHWKQNHFVVVYDIKVKKNKDGKSEGRVFVADPGHGLIKFTVEEFCAQWLSTQKGENEEGIALLLEPTPSFYEQEDFFIKSLKNSTSSFR